MHPRAEEFAAAAVERYGVDVEVHEFPEGTKTAADAAEAIGCDVAQIASSLVFVADGEPVVVVTSGANRVSEDRLAAAVDADSVRMAEPEEAREATGWSIGGVPPFCHDRELTGLIDETLLDHDEVWAAAGTPEGVFPIAPDRLVELSGAEPADVAE
jgi:prolyl-tRNA editing enzyme YbaK/EbsC (Cys-tRNA(Pro) deacylase)